MAGLATWAAIVKAVAAVAVRAWDSLCEWWTARDAKGKRAAYETAVAEWKAAIRNGDRQRILETKREVDRLRRAGWHRFAIIVAAMLLVEAGCYYRTGMDKFPVGDHILFVHPGDVVPPYPDDGEDYWLLMTPRGLEWMLPEDSPFLGEPSI